MPLDFSDPRYKGRPLLALLDAHALSLIGAMSSGDEQMKAKVVQQRLGSDDDWKVAVRRSAGLPEDMDSRIVTLWHSQPAG